jgi:NADPH:quinone reductase-like Zn-dependent oxidoreductase
VFGVRDGAFAEYVLVPEDRPVVTKPDNVTFEEAAAVGVAALTALQGLRDKGALQPGQKVLINGASGGVGTFAVQIAKALGAEVDGVCSTRNVELGTSLGADHVIDYTQEDFARRDRRYDLLLDVAGNRAWPEYKRVLAPQGTLVMVGGPKTNRWIGALGDRLKVKLMASRDTRNVATFLAKPNKEDLATLADLMNAEKVTSAIDRRYELSEIGDAFRYLGERHARAKVVITV